jgi:hypothetical protein
LTADAAFDAVRENAADADVAARDPLGADDVMAGLPAANARRDLAWITAHLRQLGAECRVDTWADARAALRDLGFLSSSALRHDPRCDLSFLEPVLARLGKLCDEVPRDTVYSYTTRNPAGGRRRTFRASDEEHLFIDSVAKSTVSLNTAVEHLAAALFDDRSHGDLLVAPLRQARHSVDVLRQNLLKVKRHVSPEYFSGELRPYFPHIRVNGRAYAGPGGAQMPLLVLDVLLMAGDADDDGSRWHRDYLRDNVIYLPPTHRAVCRRAQARVRWSNRRRLAGILREHDAARVEFTELLQETLRFRYPHRQLARANMGVRPDGSLGSGGYAVAALDHMIELTCRTVDEVGGR